MIGQRLAHGGSQGTGGPSAALCSGHSPAIFPPLDIIALHFHWTVHRSLTRHAPPPRSHFRHAAPPDVGIRRLHSCAKEKWPNVNSPEGQALNAGWSRSNHAPLVQSFSESVRMRTDVQLFVRVCSDKDRIARTSVRDCM